MKVKKLLCAMLIGMLGLFLLGNVNAEAANKSVITFETGSKRAAYGSLQVIVESTFDYSELVKIEYKKGKVKKSADKYWKKATDITGTASFTATKNGYYTVRITDINNKKYIRSIKIKDIKPAGEYGKNVAYITSIGPKAADGTYTITADFVKNISLPYKKLIGKKVGDTVKVEGNTGKITRILSFDDEGYLKEGKKTVDDYADRVMVRFSTHDNLYDYYNYPDYDPDAEYGFASRNEGADWFLYSDADFEECYANAESIIKTNVDLKLTKDSQIQPSMYDYTEYGFEYTIGAEDYALLFKELRVDYISEYATEINVYPQFWGHIYQKYDSETKTFTDEIEFIRELYTP